MSDDVPNSTLRYVTPADWASMCSTDFDAVAVHKDPPRHAAVYAVLCIRVPLFGSTKEMVEEIAAAALAQVRADITPITS